MQVVRLLIGLVLCVLVLQGTSLVQSVELPVQVFTRSIRVVVEQQCGLWKSEECSNNLLAISKSLYGSAPQYALQAGVMASRLWSPAAVEFVKFVVSIGNWSLARRMAFHAHGFSAYNETNLVKLSSCMRRCIHGTLPLDVPLDDKFSASTGCAIIAAKCKLRRNRNDFKATSMLVALAPDRVDLCSLSSYMLRTSVSVVHRLLAPFYRKSLIQDYFPRLSCDIPLESLLRRQLAHGQMSDLSLISMTVASGYMGVPPSEQLLMAITSHSYVEQLSQQVVGLEKPASSTALVDIASALVRLVVLCDYGLSSPDNTFAGLFDSLLGGMGVQVVAVLVSEFHGDERDTRGLADMRSAFSPDTAVLSGGMSPAASARSANALRPHVLVDLLSLAGFTCPGGAHLALAASGIAPVSMSMEHWLASSGGTLDTFVSDKILTPPELAAHWTEGLLLLPTGFQYVSRQQAALTPVSVDGGGGDAICLLSRLSKVGSALLDRLAALLREDSGLSVLVKSYGVPRAEVALAGQLLLAGVRPHQLHFVGRFDELTQHLTHVARTCAVTLDTAPETYGALSTALHSMAAGVPVATAAGVMGHSRGCASYARHSNTTLLLARNLDDVLLLGSRYLKQRRRTTAPSGGLEGLPAAAAWARAFSRGLAMMVEQQMQRWKRGNVIIAAR